MTILNLLPASDEAVYSNTSSKKKASKWEGPNPQLKKAVPFWTADQEPHFLERTKTAFARLPLFTALTQRGISNRLLSSLTAGLPKGAYLGGGFLTSLIQEDEKANDIDLFFRDEKAFLATYKLFAEGVPNKTRKDRKENSDLWAFNGWRISSDTLPGADGSKQRFVKFEHDTLPPVQLIKLVWYACAEHVIDSFDLTMAQFATDGEDLVFNPISFLDIARKRIVLHRMQFPASTLRRIVKYTGKGYYACPGSLANIALQVHESIQKNSSDVTNIVYLD